MGNRANVILLLPEDFNQDFKTELWIYNRWGGGEWQLKSLLSCIGNNLMDPFPEDDIWTASAIISSLIGENPKGIGVSLYQGDNEYPLVYVDAPDGTIKVDLFDDSVKVLFSKFHEIGTKVLTEIELKGKSPDCWHRKFCKAIKKESKK